MSDRRIICNTSPLLYLHQIDLLDVLMALYDHVWTTPGVVAELLEGAERGYDVPRVEDFPWIEVERPTEQAELLPALLDLDRGEAEVIALAAQTPESVAVLDERLARRIATLFEIPYTGTLGILIRAKVEGHLDHLRPALEALKETSMWLSDDLLKMVIEEAGELE